MKKFKFVIPDNMFDDAVRLFSDDYILFRVETFTKNTIKYKRVEMHKKDNYVTIR